MFVGLMVPLYAQADPLDLATIPLANSPTITIRPNLLFILDDSGSMSWDFMPDNIATTNQPCENSQPLHLCRNASYNTIAYNPAIRYTPPAFFDAGGLNTVQYPSQDGTATLFGADATTKPNWKAVKNNAYSGATTTNLNARSIYFYTIAGEYCTSSELKVCVAQSAPSVSHPFAAPLRWCTTNAIATSAANPAANACQATRVTSGTTTFTFLRRPAERIATITVSNDSNLGSITGVTVGVAQILSGTTTSSTNSNTVASRIAQNINNCTYATTGSCTAKGFFATSSGLVVTIYASPDTADALTTLTPGVTEASAKSFTRTAFAKQNVVPGNTVPRVISAATASYTVPGSASKSAERTDCAGTACTYNEEMTNYANWWSYYQTRTQSMKTSASLAFKDIAEDFRVGFMTTSTRSALSLKFDTFGTAHKASWYAKLFSAPADRNTPLRGALSKAGRIYANTETGGGIFTDPIEYECQQNFTLLTTDGGWNTADETAAFAGGPKALNGTSDVGNLDSLTLGTPRPMREGTPAVANTLADVAKYYYDTDLRTDHVGDQVMATMTLGMGVDGTLSYRSDYKTAATGAFFDIKNNTKNWPDPIANSGGERIDDLWHAAVNGGGTYFSAKNPTELVRSLKEALASVKVQLGAGSAAASSTLNPISTDNAAYVASYTSGFWTGNLEKRSIDVVTGETSPTADFCVEDVIVASGCSAPSSIVANGTGGYNCVTPGATAASCLTPDVLDGTDCKRPVGTSCTGILKNRLFSTRTIYMNNGGSLVPFSYSAIPASQQAQFESAWLAANLTQWISLTPAQQANATPGNLVNYLKGQTTFDESAALADNKVFRKRQAILGDVVDSTPAFVGKSTFSYSDPGYADFKAANAGRAKTVYVGANDGMLHAFNADTLEERWAYIPSMVIQNLWKLADTAYATKHSYYTNGEPVVSEICVLDCTGAGAVWKTILVAGLNGGGRGYYALDITDPAAPSLLWEFDASNQNNLGYTFGSPLITKRPDGTWVVLVTSGYNNIPDNSAFYALPTTQFKPNNPPRYLTGNGGGYLYVLDAASGTELSAIATGVGNDTTPSGLAKIKAFADDAEKNNTAKYVYGGDLLGNLWRFNLEDNSRMLLANLKAGGKAQPVTTSPELAVIKNKRVVYVGTGKYLEISDLTNSDQQSIYAIKDENFTVIDPHSTLVPQTLVPDGAVSRKSGAGSDADLTTTNGWVVDFPDTGERQNVAPMLVVGTLIVPTIVPTSSPCQPAGYSWFNHLNYKNGKAVDTATGIVSTKTGSPVVGFNIIYINGKPVVFARTADGQLIKMSIPFDGSGTGFQKRRSVWRELVN
jgi:type IV pilus assembly protein PilY1